MVQADKRTDEFLRGGMDMNEYLRQDGDHVLIPVKRSELKRVKAVKFSEAEAEKVDKLAEWLSLTRNPATNKPFIPQATFSEVVKLALNLLFAVAREVAEAQARAEEEGK